MVASLLVVIEEVEVSVMMKVLLASSESPAFIEELLATVESIGL